MNISPLNILWVWMLTCCLLPAKAQALQFALVSGQPIKHQRQLPEAVSRSLGANEKSLFWGTFTPDGTKTPMAIRFTLSNFQDHSTGDAKRLANYSLYVFRREGKNWQHVIKTPVAALFTPQSEQGLEEISFAAKFYWINARKKEIPLLRINVVFPLNPFYGHHGPEGNGEMLLVSFVNGWNSAPATQAFRFGQWFSSDSIGQANVVQLTANGMVRIVSQIYPASDSGPAAFYFPWDAIRGRFWSEAVAEEEFKPTFPSVKENFKL